MKVGTKRVPKGLSDEWPTRVSSTKCQSISLSLSLTLLIFYSCYNPICWMLTWVISIQRFLWTTRIGSFAFKNKISQVKCNQNDSLLFLQLISSRLDCECDTAAFSFSCRRIDDGVRRWWSGGAGSGGVEGAGYIWNPKKF